MKEPSGFGCRRDYSQDLPLPTIKYKHMENKKVIIIITGLVLAFALNAVIMGRALQRFRKEDRTISVKGFSEREVKSDLAVWTIQCRVAGNDILEGSRQIDEAGNKIAEFLIRNGISREEIIQKDLAVNDRMAQEYMNFEAQGNFRYIIDKVIQVRSFNVEKVQQVSGMTDDLLKAGVYINNRNMYGGAVRYYYTGLNEIKPDMLIEATRNAHLAASQFTGESNVRLGKLKRATQGLFSIVDRDESLNLGDGGQYGSNTMDIYKKVRVVVSVDYSIE
jgi:uncharacterized protein